MKIGLQALPVRVGLIPKKSYLGCYRLSHKRARSANPMNISVTRWSNSQMPQV